MLKNIFAVLKNPNSFIVWFLSSFLAITLWYAYSDIEYVAGNYQSHTFAYFDMILSWIMVLLLPLMIAGIVYRSLYFGIYRATERKVGFLGIFGGIIGLFITGASCCGVSLISVLGMSTVLSFLSFLPYDGIELKALGILILIYAFVDLYRNLKVCKIKSK